MIYKYTMHFIVRKETYCWISPVIMTSSYIVLHMIHLVSLFTCLFLVANFFPTNASDVPNPNKLVLRLIHRDSIPSRVYSHAKRDRNSLHTNDIRAPLVPYKTSSIFLVNFSIGEPPVPHLLAMDTGSSLIWVQCSPCTGCVSPLSPVYDPKTSSTYTKLSCDSKYRCINYYDNAYCTREFECAYGINYMDQSSNNGNLALEKLTFVTSNGGIYEVPDQVFGCGIDSRGTVTRLSGILGLQLLNQYSLVSRVGKRFSYCIGNISDPNYKYNQLILDEGAVFEGYSTPMRIKDGHYAVRLQGITIGDKQLNVNQQEFDFNVVIDTGSTLTILRRSVFDQLKEEVTKLLDGVVEMAQIVNAGERPCYWGNLVRDLKGFPVVTLQLDEGMDLDLDVEGMFKRVNDNVFCMAVDVSKDDNNIIGIFAQQYYNVGFDLNAMRVSFQNIECDLLED